MAEPEHDSKVLPRVGVREFRANITGFLRQARNGQAFLVTSHDQVLAEIHPPSRAELPRRQPGALRGKIRMEPDFDTLPPDVLAAMEGEEARSFSSTRLPYSGGWPTMTDLDSRRGI